MREYSRVTRTKLDTLGPEHKLSDFYVPSSEVVFVVLGIASPAWLPTNSLSNCMQASIAYFFWPLAACASQHNITGQTPGPVAFACWRLIWRLEYLDKTRSKAFSHLLQSPRLLEGPHSHQKAGVCSKVD